MLKILKKYRIFAVLSFLAGTAAYYTFTAVNFDNALTGEFTSGNGSLLTAAEDSSAQKITIKIDDIVDLDGKIDSYMREMYPIISDEAIAEIQSTKDVNKVLSNDTLGIVEFYLNFNVPGNYLADRPLLLWELNIPEFKSRIFQIYGNDTLLIDTWPNVVGKRSTKTFTGYYEAFKLRNWPYWKDPEAPDSVRATPPGPNNPLGLFVVHYDENSLRYFHGTNKNYLLSNENRALSHGCVRNDNKNIAKMKEMICKKIITADDLTYWIGSKKSMVYEIKPEDRFPVRIIYKTFDIRQDSYGDYIIFFKDVYNYDKGARLSVYDKPELITLTSVDNILSEYRSEHPSNHNIPDEKLIPIIENLVSNHTYYERYYFDDLVAGETGY